MTELEPAKRAVNPLYDVLPAIARKYVYALAFLGLLVYTAIQAAEGDWQKAAGSLLATLVTLLASSNTAVKP
jgi:hypothetical protein